MVVTDHFWSHSFFGREVGYELATFTAQGLTKLKWRYWPGLWSYLELGIFLQASSGYSCRIEVLFCCWLSVGLNVLEAACHSWPCGLFHNMSVFSFKAFRRVSSVALNLSDFLHLWPLDSLFKVLTWLGQAYPHSGGGDYKRSAHEGGKNLGSHFRIMSPTNGSNE